MCILTGLENTVHFINCYQNEQGSECKPLFYKLQKSDHNILQARTATRCEVISLTAIHDWNSAQCQLSVLISAHVYLRENYVI